jgi:outer membrane protein assembly factor BamD (BamD/ComL family)
MTYKSCSYFLAKKIYYTQLKKKSCESAFGLASVFYINNNPFYNLDSAYKYIQISKSDYGKLNPKKQNSISKWKISYQSISTLEHLIDSLSFSVALSKNSIDDLQTFLQKIPTTIYTVQAKEQINLIAFTEASKENTVKSYSSFIEKYPNAIQLEIAKRSLDLCRFKETAAKNNTEAYNKFILDFPSSKYIDNCQDSLFKLSAPTKSETQLSNFIRNYPNNKNVEYAWQLLYEMGNDNSANFFSNSSLSCRIIKSPLAKTSCIAESISFFKFLYCSP